MNKNDMFSEALLREPGDVAAHDRLQQALEAAGEGEDASGSAVVRKAQRAAEFASAMKRKTDAAAEGVGEEDADDDLSELEPQDFGQRLAHRPKTEVQRSGRAGCARQSNGKSGKTVDQG